MIDLTKLFGGNEELTEQAKEVGKVLINPIGAVGDVIGELLD